MKWKHVVQTIRSFNGEWTEREKKKAKTILAHSKKLNQFL